MLGLTAEKGQSGTAGIDNSTNGGHGAYGRSQKGTGVFGETKGNGQCGILGIDASTGGGFGLKGTSTKGVALNVDGRVQFSSSGTITIPQGL